MLRVIDLERSFQKFSETFTPKIVGELNGQHVKLVHVEGDKVPWHTHDDEDELFFVIDGELEVQSREGSVTVQANQFCIVPRGLEHKVLPKRHTRLMLFEPAGIEHTGKVQAEITRDHFDWLE
jgi:mannose-6-phosphate isomerase-like protein (cupin superfamily)